MRNHIKLIAAALLLCSCYAFSYKKTSEPPTGVAYYHFFHIRDTTNIGVLWEEDFVMPFNGKQSVYASATKISQDSIQMAKLEAAMQSGSNTINLGVLRQTTSDKLYLNEEQGALFINKNFNQSNYLIKEALEKINWEIEPETKEILGYTCQKAQGICKGRKYTAWFTTDIPVSFGPWKLHGLPGLILEAYDITHQIKFTCTKVVTHGSVPTSIALELPTDATTTTASAYDKMVKASNDGMSMDMMNAGGVTVDNVVIDRSVPGAKRKKFIVNFPLELTK
ncbi:GLPGLI family protein [Sphingobacterium oryzagri]|uniref:GLPGLI family protein n=1 Tax=Sphingobacterium oryzagri TaxID=3025669 RepID=A0ABY7WPE3_9SPHI|nr:GLPGLI family protein [Sphingobacterium sp. KACC 22765]WDF70419.1 GLPGLI family protein [Sphingobacterium sp. KACC 22765]